MKGILHGSWLYNYKTKDKFVFWIETIPDVLISPRTKSPNKKKKSTKQPLLKHPFHLSNQELVETFDVIKTFLGLEYTQSNNSLIKKISITLPSKENIPLPSLDMIELLKWNNNIDYNLEKDIYQLQMWSVEAIVLPINTSLSVLQSLYDLAVEFEDLLIISYELYFWLEVLVLINNILGSSSFLPMIDFIDDSEEKIVCFWTPIYHNEVFGDELRNLLQKAPTIIIHYQTSSKTEILASIEDVLKDFCKHVLNFRLMQIQYTTNWNERISSKLQTTNILSLQCLNSILTGLMTQESIRLTSPAEVAIMKEFRQIILQSIAQLETPQSSPAKLCFKLESPENEFTNINTWKLCFYLQSIHDPSLLVPARDVWREKNQTLEFLKEQFANPQELLLIGLGKAMKIFPPLGEALQTSNPEKCILNLSQTFSFLQEYSNALKAAGFGVLIPRAKDGEKNYIYKPVMQIKVSDSTSTSGILNYSSVLSFQWQIAIGTEVLTEQELQMLLKYKEPLIYLKGKWVEINSLELQKTVDFLSNQFINGQSSIESTLKLLTEANIPESTIAASIIDQPDWLTKLFTETKEFELVDVPKTFIGTLRPYQHRGVSWIIFMHKIGLNPCLADDMGLGKTIQVICFILYLKELKKIPNPIAPNISNHKSTLHVLVVCPKSVMMNWGHELKRFAPDIKWDIYQGSQRKNILGHHPEILIASYGTTRRDELDLSQNTWNLLVIDEAQNIKNPFSQQSKVIRSLKAEYRIALTGTPIENRLTELWSIFDYLQPLYLGTLTDFRRQYAQPIEVYKSPLQTKKLQYLIQPFILRRLKNDKTIINDLPDKTEIKEYCYLTKEQISLYQALVDQQLQFIKRSEGIKRRGNILATLLKLKQICNHPAQFLGDQSAIDNRSEKLTRIGELLEELVEENECALIFTQFVEMGKILQQYCQKVLKKKVLFLHGQTSTKQRTDMILRFQEQEASLPLPVFIISLKAGGTGLNLTRANHVIHFDRWWNPAVEDQATDRVFRIGQNKKVMVHKFITVGTIEEKIDTLIEQKKLLANMFIGGGEDWLTQLDNDQIKEVLSLSQTGISDDGQ